MRLAIGFFGWMLFCSSPLTARAQEPPAGERVRLGDLQAEAERNHPAIQSAARLVEAKRARVAPARALPDPVASIGWMGDIAAFRVQRGDPSSYRAVGLMEEFPWPGKLRLRGQVAEREAQAEQWNVEAQRRRIRAEVAVAFYGLWATDQALEITERHKLLLETLARIAEEKYRVGKGLQADVLRAHVEVTRILQRLTVLGQKRRTLEAQLNSLLVQPPDQRVGPLATVEKSQLTHSLAELLEHAVANAPEIRHQDELIAQGLVATNLAQKEYYPDFSVGYMYQQRPLMPDMHGFTFGVKIPVFYRSKQRRMVEEAAAAAAGARAQREAVRTELQFRIREQYLAAHASDELLNLYAKGVVPQSRLTLESALAAYQAGTLDFLTVLTDFITLLDSDIAYSEELANYQKALARLEEITGLELTAPAAPGK